MGENELQSNGSKICRMLLFYLVVTSLLYVVAEAIFKALNLNVILVDYLSSIVSIATTTLYFVKRYQKKWDIKINWRINESFGKKDLIKYILLGLGVSFLMSILVSLMMSALENVVIFETPDFTAKYTTIDNFVIFIFVVLIGPIMEELLYRGLIFKKLQNYGWWYGAIIVSLLFALGHGNIPQAIGAFFISLVLCLVTFKSDSLIPAIIIHMLNNFIAQISEYNNEVWQYIMSVFILVVALIGLILLIKEFKKRPNLQLNYRISDFFKNVWGIVFLIFMLLMIVSMIKFK